MKRRAFVVSSMGLLVAAGVTRSARADSVDDALKSVAAAREKVRTLIAPLTQERVLSLLSTSVTSHGLLTVVRPDRLRWDLEPPDEVTYWVSPEGIAYRSPKGSGRVPSGSAGPLGAVLGDVMILLGGDLSRLRERHELSVDRKDGALLLTLVPRDEKLRKLVRKLTAELFPDLVGARKLTLEEHGDDRTTITFETPRVNETVDPARMKPPA